MFTRRFLLTTTSAAVMLGPVAQAQSVRPQDVADGGVRVLNDFRRDNAFGNTMRLVRQAKAVFIVPTLLKMFGGEGGNGVLMVRNHGAWSDPTFSIISSETFGPETERTEMIMLIMSQAALDGVLRDQFKISRTETGISVVAVRSEIDTIGGSTPDIVVWASNHLVVDQSIIRAEPNLNATFYGRSISAREVLYRPAQTPGAASLHREISKIG